MEAINDDEIRQIQIEILKDVSEWCDNRNITYSLYYGSLLGCVRHHGFIPWDDDVDIMMPRNDYDRFVREYKSKNGNIRIRSPYDDNTIYTFTKVYDNRTIKIEQGVCGSDKIAIGVDIDLFPIDSFPNSEIITRILFVYIRLINRLLGIRITETFPINSMRNGFLRILQGVCRLFPTRSWILYVDRLAQMFNGCDTRYKGVRVTTNDGQRDRLPADIFSEYRIAKFEQLDISIIAKYKEYLTKMYGNYMELPPIEKRISHHSYDVYWKEMKGESNV